MTGVARPAASAPSVGFAKAHAAQEADLLARALAGDVLLIAAWRNWPNGRGEDNHLFAWLAEQLSLFVDLNPEHENGNDWRPGRPG